MEVKLLRYTPEPELTIAAAARVSTSPAPISKIMEKMTPEKARRLISDLVSMGHLSPLEHASFTFAISGISRSASHQLVRHRLASYTQQSQRFVNVKDQRYVTPPSIDSQPQWRARFQNQVSAAYELYAQMVEAGIPMEDARFVLPAAAETQLVMTVNARELLHAASLRLCPRSQWEIVALFEAIKAEVTKVAPTLGENMKPKCYKLGYCDENNSCGLFPTAKELAKKGAAS